VRKINLSTHEFQRQKQDFGFENTKMALIQEHQLGFAFQLQGYIDKNFNKTSKITSNFRPSCTHMNYAP